MALGTQISYRFLELLESVTVLTVIYLEVNTSMLNLCTKKDGSTFLTTIDNKESQSQCFWNGLIVMPVMIMFLTTTVFNSFL